MTRNHKIELSVEDIGLLKNGLVILRETARIRYSKATSEREKDRWNEVIRHSFLVEEKFP